jgi:hypothetical protein
MERTEAGTWVCIFGYRGCIVTNEDDPMRGETRDGSWTMCPPPADGCRGYAACGVEVEGTTIHDAACPRGEVRS